MTDFLDDWNLKNHMKSNKLWTTCDSRRYTDHLNICEDDLFKKYRILYDK